MNTRKVGSEKELQTVAFLQEQGVEILEQNFRSKQGEIDIIGRDGEYLVFVEVKFRKSENRGNALSAVDLRKQKKICQVADYYRYLHHYGDNTAIRYDVVAIQDEEFVWVKNAFSHIFRGR